MSELPPVNPARSRLFTWLALCLISGFLLTTLASYYTSKQSIRGAIVGTELPLTADNIYSEIQRDLVQPILISSLMANDAFVRNWVLNGEKDPAAITHYLAETKREYHTITAFFISDRTHIYYHSDAKYRTVNEHREADRWYFRVRAMQQPYEVNVDFDLNNHNAMTVFINYRALDFNGQFIGVTGVGLTVEQMNKRIREYQQKYGRDIFFSDASNAIVLSSSRYFTSGRSLTDFKELGGWTISRENTDNNVFQYQRDGEIRLVTARYIPDLQWTIFVEKSEAPALENIQNTLYSNLLICAIATALVLWLVRRLVMYYQQQLEQLAVTDALTGFYNRHGFNLLQQQFAAEMKRHPESASALLLDIDYFKRINDFYGHLTGDQVLREIARVIRDNVRASDIICRWGGEEILILIRQCTLDDARMLAEKIAQAVREKVIETATHQRVNVTVSIGVSSWENDKDVMQFFARADQAMYRAKELGRDRVEIES